MVLPSIRVWDIVPDDMWCPVDHGGTLWMSAGRIDGMLAIAPATGPWSADDGSDRLAVTFRTRDVAGRPFDLRREVSGSAMWGLTRDARGSGGYEPGASWASSPTFQWQCAQPLSFWEDGAARGIFSSSVLEARIAWGDRAPHPAYPGGRAHITIVVVSGEALVEGRRVDVSAQFPVPRLLKLLLCPTLLVSPVIRAGAATSLSATLAAGDELSPWREEGSVLRSSVRYEP